ncbi:hypothetical protein L6164_014811 [Bauhinia variegata]|uniref:Uncharacterized protein n=1 Tax=Bauhinia variegata TaxID=167791 RepID=A0ACB9NIP6_BAUVA|nr:hypothetical protein L6164_014811 [Bauhinia variegata]
MAASGALAAEPNPEVLLWLKSLPLAPEYRPTLAEFQDPISYIFKIEKEASKYGICKIVPPVPPSPKKTAIANLNRSLAARAASSDSSNSKSQPTFTTRQQQIGFCPRKPRPVQRPVWQSGEYYTFQEFEAKARAFEKNYLKKCTRKGGLSPLEIETLYWKATVDKPFSVEYANDMPGSAFVSVNGKKCKEAGEGVTLGETAWNMRWVSRANGSLLRFMKEEIPGVTSPMVYVAMLFSWFAWHVEDHDLHSLNYLHMGAGKTWYGVPRDAAVAFEEVVRVHGYGGEINPLVTFAILGEKTTVMSPEVFISAGIPCCRLVQNAGEFVVTFPRAYHTGFSHGFNCGEAANIATPEWLRVAKDAAIRRASINYPPMVSHFQLLYDLALALCSRIPGGISSEPRSSRLKDKRKGEGETVIKELFVQDVLHNNDLLHVLGKGSSIVLLPRSSSDISVCSKLRVGSQQLKVNPGFALNSCTSEGINSSKSFVSDDLMFNRSHGIKQVKGLYSVKEKFVSLCERNRISSLTINDNICTPSSKTLQRDSKRETNQGDGLSDQRLFSCVTCGILSFACVAIVQPREPAARYLMSADCSFFNDWVVGSGVTSNKFTVGHRGETMSEQNTYTGWMVKRSPDSLYDVPVQSIEYQIQIADQYNEGTLNTNRRNDSSALGLLASAYGNSSDSEEDQVNPDNTVDGDESNVMNHPSGSRCQKESPCLRGHVQCGDDFLSKNLDSYEDYKHERAKCNSRNHQNFDYIESEDYDITSMKPGGSGIPFKNMRPLPCSSLNFSQGVHDGETSIFGNAIVPIDDKNAPLMPQSDEDSSRMHVFCLEHAAEVEQQLRPIGGVHILLLCHPDYPKIEAEAKFVAEELGNNYMWKNIAYRHATKEDEERIQSALDSEEAIPGNGDWAVKLGINLFYSANLSRSPLYSKQMPYNSVIYYAFGRSPPASSTTQPKVYQRRTSKQKKVVAGKWCGKVWMSNQVHPLLAKGDSEDDDGDKTLHGWMLPDEKIERSESAHKDVTHRKFGRKRKMNAESGGARKFSQVEREAAVSDYSIEEKFSQRQRRILRSKQSKYIEREGAASEEDYSPLWHHRKPVSKRTKRIESNDVSDDSLDDNSHLQHRRNTKVKETKFIDNDMVSDDEMEYDSDWQQRGTFSSKLVNDADAFSEDSLDGGSLQLHRRTSKGKQVKYLAEEEDVISDDQMEDHLPKQHRRIPKRRQAKYLTEEDIMASDDQLEYHRQRQQQRIPKSRQAKYAAGEDITSDDQLDDRPIMYQRRTPKSRQAKYIAEDNIPDDQLEDHSLVYQRRNRKSRKAKCFVGEDVVSDDQPENHFQKQPRSVPRSRKNKCFDRDDIVMDESPEKNSHLLSRIPRRKQAECMDGNNSNSDSQEENDSHQQPKRAVRSKQSKSETLRQMKQANPRRVKRQTSLPIKRGARLLMKPKASQQMKQPPPPRVRTNQSVNSRQFSLCIEEDEEGGPSTRLRKRTPKVEKESEAKSKEKQTKKKGKNASAGYGEDKMKDEEAEYQCDIEGCSMSFGSKQELAMHKRNICPVKGCGKKFFSHKYLVQHRRVHMDDRPLRCPWKGCKMTFKWAWARTEHIRVHTGARPYVCAEPGCGQTFRFVSDFSRHKRKTGHSAKKSR